MRGRGIAAIPYGGGTSVVGGIEPRMAAERPGVVTIDLGRLDRVLEVDEVAQWDEIKAAVAEAVIAGGGTITHHHAVGRDHRPWYDRQRPERLADRRIRPGS